MKLSFSTSILLSILSPSVDAFHTSFVTPSCKVNIKPSRNFDRFINVRSTTLEPETISSPTPINGEHISPALSNTTGLASWDCDEEAVCDEVPACNEEKCRTSLDVRIHDTWYDLSGWRKAHPAGAHWIDWYDGRDATEVMDGFHTAKGREMYKRLPKSTEETTELLEKTTEKTTDIQRGFRELREKLENEGWWERDVGREVTLISIWGGLVLGAAAISTTAPFISTVLLGLSMTQAGWLGHDYIHGVDKFSMKFRNMAAVAGGLSATWWSDKHNKHHALTNEIGVDEDIATDPFLFPYVPDPENDHPLRKIQHWIFFIPFSALFALWRIDTMTATINAVETGRKDAKTELYCLLFHYAFLLSVFPITVWFPAIFLSGLLSALIVTPTHQNEEMFTEYVPDWVSAQFLSTRNAVTTNRFSEWIWGGMQYQLEHHLFPSMPRSKYPLLKPILTKFAEKYNIPGGYRESGEFEILKDNWLLYKKVAEADPIVGAPNSRGNGQLGAIDSGNTPAAGGFM